MSQLGFVGVQVSVTGIGKVRSDLNLVEKDVRNLANVMKRLSGSGPNLAPATRSLGGLQKALNALSGSARKFSGSFDIVGKTISSVSQTVAGLGMAAGAAVPGLGALSAGIGAVGTAAGATAAAIGGVLTAALVVASREAIEAERRLADMGKVMDMGPEKFKRFSDSLRGLTAEMKGLEFPEATGYAQQLAQIGIHSEKALLSGTKAVAELAETSDLAADKVATTVSRIGRAFGVLDTEMNRTSSVLTALSAISSATESDLAELIERTQGSGAAIGMTLQEVAAESAVLRDISSSLEVPASAMSAFRLKMLTEADAFAKAMNVSTDSFQRMAKADPARAMRDFINALSTKETSEQAMAMQEIGVEGIRSVEVLLKLQTGYANYERYLRSANKAYADGNVTTREYAKLTGTTSHAIGQAQKAFGAMAEKLGQGLIPTIKTAAGEFENLFKKFGNTIDVRRVEMYSRGLYAAARNLARMTSGATSTAIRMAQIADSVAKVLKLTDGRTLQEVTATGAMESAHARQGQIDDLVSELSTTEDKDLAKDIGEQIKYLLQEQQAFLEDAVKAGAGEQTTVAAERMKKEADARIAEWKSVMQQIKEGSTVNIGPFTSRLQQKDFYSSDKTPTESSQQLAKQTLDELRASHATDKKMLKGLDAIEAGGLSQEDAARNLVWADARRAINELKRKSNAGEISDEEFWRLYEPAKELLDNWTKISDKIQASDNQDFISQYRQLGPLAESGGLSRVEPPAPSTAIPPSQVIIFKEPELPQRPKAEYAERLNNLSEEETRKYFSDLGEFFKAGFSKAQKQVTSHVETLKKTVDENIFKTQLIVASPEDRARLILKRQEAGGDVDLSVAKKAALAIKTDLSDMLIPEREIFSRMEEQLRKINLGLVDTSRAPEKQARTQERQLAEAEETNRILKSARRPSSYASIIGPSAMPEPTEMALAKPNPYQTGSFGFGAGMSGFQLGFNRGGDRLGSGILGGSGSLDSAYSQRMLDREAKRLTTPAGLKERRQELADIASKQVEEEERQAIVNKEAETGEKISRKDRLEIRKRFANELKTRQQAAFSGDEESVNIALEKFGGQSQRRGKSEGQLKYLENKAKEKGELTNSGLFSEVAQSGQRDTARSKFLGERREMVQAEIDRAEKEKGKKLTLQERRAAVARGSSQWEDEIERRRSTPGKGVSIVGVNPKAKPEDAQGPQQVQINDAGYKEFEKKKLNEQYEADPAAYWQKPLEEMVAEIQKQWKSQQEGKSRNEERQVAQFDDPKYKEFEKRRLNEQYESDPKSYWDTPQEDLVAGIKKEWQGKQQQGGEGDEKKAIDTMGMITGYGKDGLQATQNLVQVVVSQAKEIQELKDGYNQLVKFTQTMMAPRGRTGQRT